MNSSRLGIRGPTTTTSSSSLLRLPSSWTSATRSSWMSQSCSEMMFMGSRRISSLSTKNPLLANSFHRGAGATTTTAILYHHPAYQQHPSGPRMMMIHSKALTIEKVQNTSTFDQRPKPENLQFGTTLSDHMLMIEYPQGATTWTSPKIVPYQDLKISPASSCLQYALQCFEGMKAYKAIDGSLRLFRPDMNMKRLSNSMNRLHMPGWDFNQQELIACIAQLVKLDEKWIPIGDGYSLYLRPTVIATHKYLGVVPPESVLLYVISSPVGPYYKTGFAPVRLTADTSYVRAWPGGTGGNKVGANYGPTLKPQAGGAKEGYSQILWIFGDNAEITEVGSMNVFFVIQNKQTNRPELITPPLTRGDILPGVTRDSILYLAQQWDDMDVSERVLTMNEVIVAAQEGRLLEAFGAGTACVVCPISCIQFKGKDIDIPATGPITQRCWDQITGIQYGRIDGPQGWSITI